MDSSGIELTFPGVLVAKDEPAIRDAIEERLWGSLASLPVDQACENAGNPDFKEISVSTVNICNERLDATVTVVFDEVTRTDCANITNIAQQACSLDVEICMKTGAGAVRYLENHYGTPCFDL